MVKPDKNNAQCNALRSQVSLKVEMPPSRVSPATEVVRTQLACPWRWLIRGRSDQGQPATRCGNTGLVRCGLIRPGGHQAAQVGRQTPAKHRCMLIAAQPCAWRGPILSPQRPSLEHRVHIYGLLTRHAGIEPTCSAQLMPSLGCASLVVGTALHEAHCYLWGFVGKSLINAVGAPSYR